MLFNPKFGALGMYVLPRRWYGILTFPVDFLIKFLVFPLGVYFYFTSPSGKILFWDIFFYYYLVALIRNLLVNGVLVNYFDWLFIRTFKTKREYIFLTFFRIFTGFIFESLQMVCNMLGY